MNEIKLYKSPWKALKLMLLCSPFVALSVWQFCNHGTMPVWLVWAAMGFFGLGIIFGLFNLFDRRPQIIINETGIFDRNAYTDYINWEAIDHAYWKTIRNQSFICLIIKDEYKELIKGRSKIKELNIAMGFQEINISLSFLGVDKEKLTALIIALHDAKPTERNKLISENLIA